jgi:DNA-binding NtrC family response regulator
MPEERGTNERSVQELRRQLTPSASLPPRICDPASDPLGGATSSTKAGKWLSLAEMEEEHVRRTLEETFYNQSAAAELLGVDRKQLARKIKKYGLEMPSRRRGRPTRHRAYETKKVLNG